MELKGNILGIWPFPLLSILTSLIDIAPIRIGLYIESYSAIWVSVMLRLKNEILPMSFSVEIKEMWPEATGLAR